MKNLRDVFEFFVLTFKFEDTMISHFCLAASVFILDNADLHDLLATQAMPIFLVFVDVSGIPFTNHAVQIVFLF